MLSASERLSIGPYISRTFGLPDLIAIGRRKTIRAALKLVNWDGSTAASTMPDCRCCLILRHPCGQIASTQAGEAGQAVSATGRHRFVREAGLPSDIRRAAAFAASRGVDAAAYEALPNAGKLAWVWRAFNEPLVAGLRNLPNTKIVVYEDLCRNPEAVARNLFAFADLDWSAQTSAFLDSSTNSERD